MILPDLIQSHAEKTPDDVALIFRDQTITYREVQEKILKCAQGLAQLGLKKGDTWGLFVRNCPEFLILSMALAKLGAVVVPINFLEKPDRIALILNDARAVGILTSKEFVKTITAAAASIKSLKHFYLRDASDEKFKNFSDLMNGTPWTGTSPANENDMMMLLYTSGTTGLPKGVMLSNKNFLVNVDQCLGGIALKKSDRFMCLLPLFHSFSWTTCLMIPMKLGASTVIIESLLPFDPVIKAIWNHKVTLFVAVPQIFSALTTKIKGVKALVVRLMNPIRVCISGAAPLPAAVHESFEKTFGVKLLEGYGLTEAAPVVSMNREAKRKVGTVGKALPGVTIELRSEEGKPVPTGDVGEIFVRGENLMKGYYNKPAETKEALTADGWLVTGDMGRLDEDGYLTIVDRKKDLIIVKGLNVYPQEVENVIAENESVKEVAVVGKVDKTDGEEIIFAYVTAQEGKTIDKPALFALCREKLAAYKRPREIVVIDEMPKNALQKILKKDLRQRP